MLFTPPWAGTALAVLSVGWWLGAAARAARRGTHMWHCHVCCGTGVAAAIRGTLCQPALPEEGSLAE